MTKSEDLIKKYKENSEYTHGFVTDIETIEVPQGLNEETIKFISNKKEPEWMLAWGIESL